MARDASNAYRIAPATVDHAAALPAIESAAAVLFSDEDVPPRLKEMAIPEAMHRCAAEEGRLWVALDEADEPVGFAHVTILDGEAHVFEIDVHPSHARRGVGTRLMRAVADWARAEGLAAVTLTTFRHLRWNAPFYARLGFREIREADLTPGLRAQLRQEAANGLDPTKRVAMRWELAP